MNGFLVVLSFLLIVLITLAVSAFILWVGCITCRLKHRKVASIISWILTIVTGTWWIYGLGRVLGKYKEDKQNDRT